MRKAGMCKVVNLLNSMYVAINDAIYHFCGAVNESELREIDIYVNRLNELYDCAVECVDFDLTGNMIDLSNESIRIYHDLNTLYKCPKIEEKTNELSEVIAEICKIYSCEICTGK